MKNIFRKLAVLSLTAVTLLAGCGSYTELNAAPADSAEPTRSESALFSEPEMEAEPSDEKSAAEPVTSDSSISYVEYHFRSKKLLEQHFEKHSGEFGDEFGYETASDYEKGASDVINSSGALHKTEKEDGDGVYYIEATNEFVVLSTDGYIRTYFRPDSGKKYYDKQ